jgi:polyphenol oxidase
MTSILFAKNLREGGFLHGFTTRLGGCSKGCHASLNLSVNVGDDPADVDQNRRQLGEMAGFSWESLLGLSQVHGKDVLVSDRPLAEMPDESKRCFDASVTRRTDLVLGIRTADCFPILLACAKPRAVGAVHAGWRGILEGVVQQAVMAMRDGMGCRPEDLLAAVGPGIHRCCFTVGEDVHQKFLEPFGSAVAVVSESGSFTVDLPAACRGRLIQSGVREEHIEVLQTCTSCRSDLFFSHRRDRGKTGRHLAYISPSHCLVPMTSGKIPPH